VILTGLQKLYTLHLDGTPSREVIPGTALFWVEVLTVDRIWAQARDQPRLEAAFAILGRTRERWPAPAHLLAALPRPDEKHQRRLDKPKQDPARARASIAEAEQLLRGINRRETPPIPTEGTAT
jgi:hypothetical protein